MRENPYSMVIPILRTDPVPARMYPVFTSIARLFSQPGSAPAADPVQRLFEQAAGRTPDQARELREAAAAWLRVIR